MIRIACLVLALSALAACDGAGPTETPPALPPPLVSPPPPASPAAGITYTAPPTTTEGLVGEEDGRGFAFALASIFQTTGNVGALTYAASPAAGAITARIDGDSLRIVLESVGSGFVSVTATSAAGVRASGDIAVRSTGRCPAAVPEGQVALIPGLSEATEWHFAVGGEEQPSGSPRYRTSGVVNLRFGAATCSDGTRMQTVTETTSIRTSSQNLMTGDYDPYGEPRMQTSQYVWTTTATETTTSALPLGVRNREAIPPFGRRVPRTVDASKFASGTYNHYNGSGFAPRVSFTPQAGLVSFSATTNYGTAGNGSVTWTRP